MTLDKCWVDALCEMRYLVGPDLPRYRLDVLACPSVDDGERKLETLDPGLLSRCPDYGYNWFVNLPEQEMDPKYRDSYFLGQRGRMGRNAATTVLLTETWYYGGMWSSDGTSKIWPEGHGWYAAQGGGWDTSFKRHEYDARHMRGRAVNVAFMAGNVELLYPPENPDPADPAAHPLSAQHFARTL